jgi:hypothetical protein
MRRYPSARRAALLLLVIGAVSCAGSERGPGEPSVVTGVVVEIESRGLNQVDSFTIKNLDTRTKILVDDDTEFSFTPSHLSQHRATGQPVAVEVDRQGGDLVARSVRDA